MTIAWHSLGHLSNQLDPSTNRVRYRWSRNGFEYVTRLMNFPHIVLMLRPPLAVISPVAAAAFWHEHALLLFEPWPFPEFKKKKKNWH